MSLTEREKKITNKATLEVMDELDYPEGGFVSAAVAQKIVDKVLSRIREEQEPFCVYNEQESKIFILKNKFDIIKDENGNIFSFTTPPASDPKEHDCSELVEALELIRKGDDSPRTLAMVALANHAKRMNGEKS